MPVILTILGFLWWWPLGLLILAVMIAGGRFGFRRRAAFAGEGPMLDWEHGGDRFERKIARMQEKIEKVRDRMERVRNRGAWSGSGRSGNSAFDEYRTETLKRLEEEQREFKDFLGRLRFAKDRAEFDQFMTERRRGPLGPDSPTEPPAAPRD